MATDDSLDISLDEVLKQLRDVRLPLLRLHKALLDSERLVYEQQYGTIASNMEFFRLVLEHEHFQWLRPMSQWIANFDDALAAKHKPMTLATAIAFQNSVKQLVQSSPLDPTHGRKYYEALERDARVAKMHVEVSALLQG
ncbi:MAG: hypothetical protein VKJ24_17675 [Synechococcales bacterium]|nr:hypothetical protein [Synechococcales bacterium]